MDIARAGLSCYLLVFPAKKRTPSPSETAMVWARLVLASMAIALRRIVKGSPVSGDGTGGSMMS